MLRQALVPCLLLLALPVRLPAQPEPEGVEQPEVIVVTGRLPGPPLWKGSNGDNVLWIFPSFAPPGAIAEFKLEYDESVEHMEALMNSLPPDKERDCFELELRRMEIDLDAIKRRANEWANGRIDEFRAVHLQTGDNPCAAMFSTSSEGEVLKDLARQSQEKWLSGAEDGLTHHRTRFAVLDIGDLLNEDGLLSKLAAKGYSVRAPD